MVVLAAFPLGMAEMAAQGGLVELEGLAAFPSVTVGMEVSVVPEASNNLR